MTTSKSHVLWVCQANGTNLKKKGKHYLEKQTERKKRLLQTLSYTRRERTI